MIKIISSLAPKVEQKNYDYVINPKDPLDDGEIAHIVFKNGIPAEARHGVSTDFQPGFHTHRWTWWETTFEDGVLTR